MNGIDKDQCTILASLDLSAAFDTVDHDIFIGRMHAYGIRETALKWFQSYLDRRSYRVLINNAFSSAHTLSCGVPQGSVLRARMYTIYVAPLANVIKKYSINCLCSILDEHAPLYTTCKQYRELYRKRSPWYPRLHYRCREMHNASEDDA